MQLRARLYRWHRWIGLIAGLQLMIWVATGLFMAVVPIDVVRGKHLASEAKPPLVTLSGDIKSLSAILNAHHDGVVRSATLRDHLGGPVYEVDYGDGHLHLFDAITGDLLSPLPRRSIEALARRAMKADVAIASAQLLTGTPPIDYRKEMPVWQVTMADAAGTRLYIQPDSGALLARRTDTWRVHDFLWGLHIMDYGARENINNILLRGFALVALLLTGTGAALLIARYWPRRRVRG